MSTIGLEARDTFNGPKLEHLQDVTLLVGSALSGDAANGLPGGRALTEGTFKRLVSFDPELSWDQFKRWAGMAPFEQVLNDHPEPARLERLFREHYSVTDTNAFQKKLASLSKGRVRAVVTTNYDRTLEIALTNEGVAIKSIVGPADVAGLGEIPVFKIHGSVERMDQPLVLRLREEGLLHDWKGRLFRELCEGSTVYVVGYSGRDFDICPVLFGSDCSSLYWLERAPNSDDPFALSANLRHAIEHRDRLPGFELVVGSFNDFLEEQAKYTPAPNADAIVEEIFAGSASPNAYKFWAVTFFHAISCRTAAEAILRKIQPSTPAEVARALHLQSDLEERRGAYLTSERTLREVVRRQRALRDWDEVARATIQRAWRLYTGFFPIGFVWAWLCAEFHIGWTGLVRQTEADAPLAHARLVYVRVLARAMFRAVPKVDGIVERVWRRKRVVGMATKALGVFGAKGLWQEYHLLAKQLDELGLDRSATEASGILPASFGFGQLGNLVGEASAYRRGPTDRRGTGAAHPRRFACVRTAPRVLEILLGGPPFGVLSVEQQPYAPSGLRRLSRLRVV